MIVCLDGHDVLLDHPMCPLPCVGRSLLEQKINKMAVELTGRQLERETTAREYKRCMHVCWMDMVCCWITLCVLPLCVGCSLLEQKVEQLTEMAAELTRKQLEREATALEYKRCMHVCWMDMLCCWITLCVCLLVCWVQYDGTKS